MKRIQILVDEQTYQEARIILLKRKETVSAWVRRLLKALVEKHE